MGVGGQIASTFDHPEEAVLGRCDLVDEVSIGEDRLIRFSGCASGHACTVVLRGATVQLLEEAERSLHDAFAVLVSMFRSDKRIVYGGGASELLMAQAVDVAAASYSHSATSTTIESFASGKKTLSMEAFARALRALPMAIADNGGLDSAELIGQLRAKHAQGQATAGLDMRRGSVGCMVELGVVETLKSKRQVVLSAAEAAEMILRVDDIVRAAPRQRTRH